MGDITEAKRIYDQFAADYFKQKGWTPFIIDIRGKTVADVVATHGRDVAIAEVKSICEVSCGKNWDDTKNTAAGLDNRVVSYLKSARLTVSALFPNRTQKTERFYAITVACQLFRYFSEFEHILPIYSRKIDSQSITSIRTNSKIPYFIVPIEYSAKANSALDVLVSNRYLRSYSIDRTSRIYIIKIVFTSL